MMENAQPPRLHFLFRCIFFSAAGSAACLVLAGLALQRWSIDWPLVAALAVVGSGAAGLDVLVFEKEHWSIFSAFLIWFTGFVCLAVLMTAVLLIPYAVMAGGSKALGIWEAWENINDPLAILIPLLVGGIFGYFVWRLIDDY